MGTGDLTREPPSISAKKQATFRPSGPPQRRLQGPISPNPKICPPRWTANPWTDSLPKNRPKPILPRRSHRKQSLPRQNLPRQEARNEIGAVLVCGFGGVGRRTRWLRRSREAVTKREWTAPSHRHFAGRSVQVRVQR